MCKKAYRREEIAPIAAGAYEGQTIRIGSSGGPREEHSHAGWARGFPWWSLWLIWPLIGALKWAALVSGGALAALRDGIGAFEWPAVALVAVVLIVAGLVLIRRG